MYKVSLADERGTRPAGAEGQPGNEIIGFNGRRHHSGRGLVGVQKLGLAADAL